jgi:TonB family protein
MSRGAAINDLTLLRLNAPFVEGEEKPLPWRGPEPNAPSSLRHEPMFLMPRDAAKARAAGRVVIIELPAAEPEPEDAEEKVRHLAFPRLNDDVVEGKEAPRPWPQPEGGHRTLPLAEIVAEVLDLKQVLEGEPESKWRFRITRERAVSASIIFHLLVLLFIVVTPPHRPGVPEELNDVSDPLGLMRLWKPDPTPPPIPLQFFPAPGPKAPAPGPNPRLSDLDRQSHGGDAKLPKLTQPRSQAREGIQDLEAGKRASGGEPTPPPAGRAGRETAAPKGEQPRSLTDLRRDGRRWEDSGFRPPLQGIPPSPLSALRPDESALRTREGARGSESGGEGGAGFEHEGGFVDSGPLSFDTKGYDWGAYAAEMLRKIKRNWDVPSLARYGIKGKLVVRFFILKDGTVDAARIVASSGIPPFDNSSFQAIVRSNPFRPLPADLGTDREGVTITFYYNIRLEDEYRSPGGTP